MPSESPTADLEPSYFGGRFMVEIEQWNYELHVRLSHPSMPPEHRIQGGLSYSRSIEIIGRVRAPSPHRGKLVRVWLSPFGPEVDFSADGRDSVGQFYRNRPDELGSDFQANLDLPETALSPALTCLSSVWKYLDIWTLDEGPQTGVTAFSFSAAIHPNLAGWAGPALDSH